MYALTTEIISRLSPLSGLGADSLAQVLSLANLEEIPRSTQPFNFEWEHRVVYLLKGELKLDYPDGHMKVLVGSHDEALSSFPRGGDLILTPRAITDVVLLWFDENALDILLTWDQLVPMTTVQSSGGDDTADWRTMTGIFDARKLTLGTFACLPAAHIESLLTCFKRQRVSAGEVIIRQGGSGDYYYLIEHGRASVTREVAGACLELAEIKAGDAFGEEALIAETTRNATVTMETDGDLLRLDRTDFNRLLREPLLQRLDPQAAAGRVAAGAVWLDVRFPVEYRYDGQPQAINIPLNELRNALPSLRRDRAYVVYCQTGRRSSAAAFLLSQYGFQAYLLEGGLNSMTSTGGLSA
jgi:rhodanese-related sulfurtransferase